MNLKRLTALFVTLILFTGNSMAEGIKLGAELPSWKDLAGVDGKKHSSDDLKAKKAVVVVFFDNSCPDCTRYSDRINAIAGEYQDKGVATILLSVGKQEDDTIEEMISRAKKKNFKAQYIKDPTQKLGKVFGAKVTPHVFVFDADKKLVYSGAVDDHPRVDRIKRHHLRLALDEVLAGKKVSVAETEAMGCDIEYEE